MRFVLSETVVEHQKKTKKHWFLTKKQRKQAFLKTYIKKDSDPNFKNKTP